MNKNVSQVHELEVNWMCCRVIAVPLNLITEVGLKCSCNVMVQEVGDPHIFVGCSCWWEPRKAEDASIGAYHYIFRIL